MINILANTLICPLFEGHLKSQKMEEKANKNKRKYELQFKKDAVQMLADGHRAVEIVRNLGISSTNLLYNWRTKFALQNSPDGQISDSQRIIKLEKELLLVKRQRDILKKALSILGQKN